MKKDRLCQTPRSPAAALLKAAFAVTAACTLVACGGSSSTGVEPSGVSPPSETRADLPSSRSEAARFLTQATFDPTDADTDRVMALGYTAWVNEQFGKPATSHRSTWEAADAAAKAVNANNGVWQDGVINSFWKQALTADDQLRGRVAYALSQIFVISMQDGAVGDNPRAVAAYLDMLGDKGFGNYRDLLESVAMHPMMASYLTAIRNQKADGKGRVPDENFAREIIQLMSIGLHMLNLDGSVQQSNGVAVEAYTQADISGLAKVFTGWSWDCPDGPDNSCFFWGSVNSVSDPDRTFKSLLGYAQYHSAEEKTFLGTTVATQSRAPTRTRA